MHDFSKMSIDLKNQKLTHNQKREKNPLFITQNYIFKTKII